MYKVPLMRPSLPDKNKFIKIIDELWETRMLSNFSKYSQKFEQDMKNINNSNREFLSVVSCDIGLTLLFKTFEIKDSEILVPSFTFNSTINSIAWNNLIPVFVDIDPKTYCIDVEDLKRKITSKTRAILATHIFGNPANCSELEKIAKENNLYLFFDSAHGFGSKHRGKSVSEYGDAGVYSFSGTKVVTSAEGGMAYFKDKEKAERFYLARNYGISKNYDTKILGLNGKVSEFHSALACLAIENSNKIIERRLEVVSMYKDGLKGFEFQEVKENDFSSYKDFSILTENRNYLHDKLEECGIQTKKYFFPSHMTSYYKKYNNNLKNTEYVYDKILCLPIFNDITNDQIQYVINSLIKLI